MLSLFNEESDGPVEQKRRLVATIRPDGGSAELEIVVASDDAIQGNIENRMAYLGHDQALEDEQQLSVSHPAPLRLIGTSPQILRRRHHQLPRGQVERRTPGIG